MPGFAEKQVDMVRHNHIRINKEVMACAESFECFLEDCAGLIVIEVWVLVVTSESDEVVVTGSLVSLEAAGHGEMVVQVLVVRAFGVPHSCAEKSA